MRAQTFCQEREEEERFAILTLSGLVLCRCLLRPVTIQLALPSLVDHRKALISVKVYVLAEI